MDITIEGLRQRIDQVRQRISAAAARANRSPGEIALIAISKTHPAEKIRSAIESGLTEFGENRVQEAEQKIPEVGRKAATWHLVGHLQANKARKAVKLFDCIHSLDSGDLARRLDRLCEEEERDALRVLIQVDLGGESTKNGVGEKELRDLVEATIDCRRLHLVGLMTLPPFFEDPECVRPFFKALRELRDQLAGEGRFGNGSGELSMGMSHDFEVAIEEGATMIRVGTAIFGSRET